MDENTMVGKFRVSARPVQGHAFAWRAGRAWTPESIVIEAVAQQEDSAPPPGLVLGQRSIAQLLSDRRFSVVTVPVSTPLGSPPVGKHDPVALERQVADLQAQVRDLQRYIRDREERERAEPQASVAPSPADPSKTAPSARQQR